MLQAIKLPLKDPVQPLEGQLSSQNRWHAASVPERVAAAELLEVSCNYACPQDICFAAVGLQLHQASKAKTDRPSESRPSWPTTRSPHCVQGLCLLHTAAKTVAAQEGLLEVRR